ncbi:MAG: ABC transporter permease [Nitrolancea sp.]
MHLNMIRTIFRKDLRDAIRDSRVLVAVLVPIGIGILYNFMFSDTSAVQNAKIGWYSPDSTQLIKDISDVAGTNVQLSFVQEPSPDAVRTAVGKKNVDIGIIVPAGFDAAVQGGATPGLTVLLPETSNFGGDYVSAAIEAALNRMAGRQQLAQINVSRVSAGEVTSEAIFNRLGLRKYFVLVAIALEIGMISMLAVPIILTEEVEKRTIDALVLVTSYLDIVVAKALVGLAYIAVAVALLLSITRIAPERIALFVGALLALSVTLIGFGLLIGGLFRSANQLNTWGGVIMLPILAPAFAVGLPIPDWLNTIFDFIPTSQATKMMIDSMTNQQFFGQAWMAFVVMIVWALAAYALLVRRLGQRVT